MAYKVPSDIVKASKALCYSILNAAGGSSAVANSLDWNRQNVHKFMRIGYVPLKSVHEVAVLLNVSPWCLSYFKLMEALGEESIPFRLVVNKTALLPAEKARILGMLK